MKDQDSNWDSTMFTTIYYDQYRLNAGNTYPTMDEAVRKIMLDWANHITDEPVVILTETETGATIGTITKHNVHACTLGQVTLTDGTHTRYMAVQHPQYMNDGTHYYTDKPRFTVEQLRHAPAHIGARIAA